MPVQLLNPYLTLAELKRELKIKATDTGRDDALNEAINMASRWVDHYTGKTYFLHDYSGTPLELDEFDGKDYDETLYLPHRPVIAITALTVGGVAWVDGVDYVAKPDKLVSLKEAWAPERASGRVVRITGRFGYDQPQTVATAAISAGGTGYSNDDVLSVVGGSYSSPAVLKATTVAGGVITAVAITDGGSYSVVPANPVATHHNDGHNATFNLTWQTDPDGVPAGIPGYVNLAARLVAAALSGEDRKEVAGLDGQRLEIENRSIPDTVFKILGKQSPVFL